MIRVDIDMKLPSLNDYTAVCRANKYRAAKFKRDLERGIGYFIGRVPRFKRPIMIHFVWIEGNKRRDYDNVAFAKKFILDALVKRGKLKDDNRNCVIGFRDSFRYAKDTKVILFIQEVDEDGK